MSLLIADAMVIDLPVAYASGDGFALAAPAAGIEVVQEFTGLSPWASMSEQSLEDDGAGRAIDPAFVILGKEVFDDIDDPDCSTRGERSSIACPGGAPSFIVGKTRGIGDGGELSDGIVFVGGGVKPFIVLVYTDELTSTEFDQVGLDRAVDAEPER